MGKIQLRSMKFGFVIKVIITNMYVKFQNKLWVLLEEVTVQLI